MNLSPKHIACCLVCLLWGMQGFMQMLPVKADRLWGVIDAEGKRIAPPVYDAVSEISERQIVVVQGGKYGLLGQSGNLLIGTQYTFLQRVNDRISLVNLGGDCQGTDCEGGKWGIINLGLNQTLAPAYSLIQPFDNNGLALANVGGKCGYDSCEGGRWGLVDTAAREVLPPHYLQVVVIDRREALIQAETGWGIYDLVQQRILIQPRYEELQRLNATRITMRSGKLWGLLDNAGDTIAPPQFQGFKDGGKGYLAWQQNFKYGLMDSMGRMITPARYDEVMMQDFGWLRIKNDNYYGLSDTSDRDITRADLNDILHYGDGFAIVQRMQGKGAVNRKGEEIIPVRHDECRLANDSLILARTGLRLRWHDTQGVLKTSIVFDSLTGFSQNNVARGRYKGRWGLINREGQWVIPAKYDDVRVYYQAAKAKLGDQVDFFYFDAAGHPSTIKRIVIIKDEEEMEDADLLNARGTAFSGWFATSQGLWGLREPRTGRILIEPSFKTIDVVPGTSITCVKGKIKGSEDWAWGLVNHVTGKVLTEFLFETIVTRDFFNNPMARAIYFGSGRYTLLGLDGHTVPFANAAYIGGFVNGVARINLGGVMAWKPEPNIDSISSLATVDRFTNEEKRTYQYCVGGKWGYVDAEGKWLKQVEYDAALDFEGGLARVRVQGKWGAVNAAFQVVVEPRYDFIERLMQVGDKTLFTVGQDKVAYGFIDDQGEISIKASFDEVAQFHGGMVRIRKDKLWGYADRTGQVVIQPQYVDAGDFYEGRARVRNARAWGFIDSLGNNVTPQKYLRAGDFREGLAWVQGEKFFGFVDLQGNMAIAPAYSAVGDFSEGLAPAKRKGAYGLIDRNGRWVVQPSYYRIGKFHDSLAVVQEMGNFGLVKPTGEFVVKPIYKEIADFSEGLARFRNGMEYGYLDRLGNTVISSAYSNAGDFSCGLAAIFVQGKWGFIDTAGTVVVPAQYPKVHAFREHRAVVRVGDKWGFIDPVGNVAVPIIYDRVSDFQDGRAAVMIAGQGWGFVNVDGTIVIPCAYDEIGFRKNGIISVRVGRKWGLINGFGAQMTPCKYDVIGPYHEGLASVLLRRSIGIVDDTGKVLLEPHFDTVTRMGDIMQVEDEDAIGYIDFTGRWIWQPTK